MYSPGKISTPLLPLLSNVSFRHPQPLNLALHRIFLVPPNTNALPRDSSQDDTPFEDTNFLTALGEFA